MAYTVAGRADVAELGLSERLAKKQKEADILKSRIMQTRLEAQQLRLRLQAFGVSNPSFVPGQICAGAGASGGSDNHPELRSLLEWLAESVDLTRQVTFECGSNGTGVAVGGRRVLLQRMAAMPLGSGPSSKLQLSVPLELQAEISGLLSKMRSRGCKAAEADIAKVAERWELVGAEMVSAATGQQEPAIFLVHRDGGSDGGSKPARAIVIAQWPSVDFAQLAAATVFSPEQHFERLEASKPKDDVAKPKVSTGDRVVIKYHGQYFHGVLQRVDFACRVANVKCDMDSPGVITVVPLESVWPAGTPPVPPGEVMEAAQKENLRPENLRPDEAQKQVLRHVRAKTIG